MSIHLYSENHTTGSRTNGTWNLYDTIQGRYTVLSQSFTVQDIPWIWDGIHSLKIYSQGSDITHQSTATIHFDYATLGFSSDTTVIANSLQTSINNVTQNFVDVSTRRTCTVTYGTDTNGNYYNLAFDDDVLLWFADSNSTIKYVFNVFTNQFIIDFKIYTTYMQTNPKFLYIYITEANSYYLTDNRNEARPTLLISTRDTELTNQDIYISNSVSILTIKLYRTNMITIPVPLADTWEMILINN